MGVRGIEPRTTESFAKSWPGREGEFADKFNSMPKHVASRTLTKAPWNASILESDVLVDAFMTVDGVLQAPGGPEEATLNPIT